MANTEATLNDLRQQLQRLPKFNKSNPQLWFAQLERLVNLHNAVCDDHKFDLVSIQLEGDAVHAFDCC
ncbi:GL20825 [Drosophila persimilis]|uniref:GL20825 n=1 Tax=Drosophila persimilis TaxID=7234 RepID=B4HDE1_DROPE|nr:GL20825 [Drosophila persimilis]